MIETPRVGATVGLLAQKPVSVGMASRLLLARPMTDRILRLPASSEDPSPSPFGATPGVNTRTRVDWRGVLAFVAIACGVSWAIQLPLWFGVPRTEGLGVMLLAASMFGPAVATFCVVRWISPLPRASHALGIRLGRPGTRLTGYVAAWLGTLAMVVATPFVAAALGLFELDLATFSGFEAHLRAVAGDQLFATFTVRQLVGWSVVGMLAAPLLNFPPSFGEEVGWRGYLLPQLLPLGRWRALVLSGLIWGAWHAPIIVLGHNYPGHPLLGPWMMLGMCVLLGVLFGALRLFTGSVLPAAVAHGTLNGAAAVPVMLGAAGSTFDPLVVGITGWTGWLVPGALVLMWVVVGRMRRGATGTTDAA